MNRWRLGLAILTGLAVLVAAAGARGQEQLIMPYVCEATGGHVALFRAPEDRSYKIHGVREHQIFSYCPPQTPGRCRNWMLHRFDLDCAGVRVSWLEVAEASAPHETTWVEDGRMSLEIGPGHGMERRERPFRRWRERRSRHFDDANYEGERPPFGPPGDVIELPAGFAPVFGTQARFAGTPVAEVQQEATTPALETPVPSTVPLPVRRGAVPSPAKEQVVETTENPGAFPSTPEDEKTPAASESPEAQGATPAARVIPTIINRPQGATPPPPLDKTVLPAADAAQHTSEPDPGAAPSPASVAGTKTPPTTAPPEKIPATTVAEPKPPAAGAPPAPIVATGSLENNEQPRPSFRRVPATAAMIGLALVGLVLASSFFFTWARRQEHMRVASLARRDLANVAFDSEERRAGSLAPVARAAASNAMPSNDPEATAGAAEPNLSPESVAMPTSLTEALEVLGASPDAGVNVIKKIVDGLRQSWHPDRATSDDDHRYREQRVKQINVAWDIISGRQQPAS